MDVDLPAAHQQALDATSVIVAGISPDQWTGPTPCAGWDVRALLNHVVAGNWWVPPLVEGRTIDEVGTRLDGDVLGDDPTDAYRRSAADAGRAFAAPGAMEAPVAVSYGPVPGSVYCGHRLLDVLVHGWDLAHATGQDTTLDPALVDVCWAVVEPELAMLASSGAFGTDHAVPAGADPQTRLLTSLGRHP